jgi:hypothetical protein
MALTTPRLALPYPVPDDTVDVPRDVKALTDKLDPLATTFLQGTAASRPVAGVSGRLHYATDTGVVSYDTGTAWVTVAAPSSSGVPLVTSLPSSPADGQEVYYQVDATNGIVWHLRYRVASSSPYKWEVVGGPPVLIRAENLFSVGVNGPWSTDTNCGITVPLAGDYICDYGGVLSSSVASVAAEMRVAYGGTASVEVFKGGNESVGNASMVNAQWKFSAVPAASTIYVQTHPAGAAVCNSYRRYLSVQPVRLG